MKKESLKRPESGAPGAEKPRSGARGTELPGSGARGTRQSIRSAQQPSIEYDPHDSEVPTYANPHPNGVLATWERGRGWVTEEPSAKKRGKRSHGGPFEDPAADLLLVLQALRLTERKLLRSPIERLCYRLGVPVLDLAGLYKDGRGSHWQERRVTPRYLVSVRGQGENQVTLELAAQAVERTPQALNVALSKGRGAATFTVNDEIITVQRFAAGGHRA